MIAFFAAFRIKGPLPSPLVMPDGTSLISNIPFLVFAAACLTGLVVLPMLSIGILQAKKVRSFFVFHQIQQTLMSTFNLSFLKPVLIGIIAFELFSHILRAIVDWLT